MKIQLIIQKETGTLCVLRFLSVLLIYFSSVRRMTAYEPIPNTAPITRNERIGKNRLVVPLLINPIAFITNSAAALTNSCENTNRNSEVTRRITQLSPTPMNSDTTIMITHNEEIAQMADRTIRIEDGKVVAGGVRYAH